MSRSIYLVALLSSVVVSAPITAVLAQEIPEVKVEAGERMRLMDVDREPVERRLSLRNVDFTDARDVDRLYRHLRFVAYDVCNSGPNASRSADQRCAARALNGAVTDIDLPVLTRYHAQISGGEVMVAANHK
ncbi:UrcA family protein [Asticcacaulis endophyticus]|uniref:UrcA family protein n=1 Tax=Asticcacaulis endophyticus TaxID=1395890 RepID=A0A918UV95_9CAUL|nr:UrcA family protein [Asticcacaulis endophyticus]GGZ35256.1 hypothetical protein GCM10011273_22210 [Asticcacaulis endophyticus]